VDDQHGAARLFAHGFSPASLRQGRDSGTHGETKPMLDRMRLGSTPLS
jgi:hypothetical protein